MATNVIPVAICNGAVYNFFAGVKYTASGTYTLSTGATDIQSAEAYSKLYIVDGTNYNAFTPPASPYTSAGSVATWTAGVGTLPIDNSNTYTARLICLWHGRLVLSGIIGDPNNWFMSKLGDPTDWDYGASPVTQVMAVAGNNSDAGLVGDQITGLLPINEERLVFGAANSIYMMSGDPAAGGRIDRISDQTGMVWGHAHARDPEGDAYFMGTNGVYVIHRPVMFQNVVPELLSGGKIDAALRGVDLSLNRVRLVWDTSHQGLHVYITLVATGASTHYFWDKRVGAWWPDAYPDACGPTAVFALRGDTAVERVVLLGGRDGYIRMIADSALTDDGTAISSSVLIGPIRLGGQGLNTILKRISASLGANTTGLTYTVYAGASPEEAATSAAIFTGAWTSGGRKLDIRARARGDAVYVKISNAVLGKTWALEELSAEVELGGIVQGGV